MDFFVHSSPCFHGLHCFLYIVVVLASQEEHHCHFTLHNTTMDDKDRCAPPTKGASTPPGHPGCLRIKCTVMGEKGGIELASLIDLQGHLESLPLWGWKVATR